MFAPRPNKTMEPAEDTVQQIQTHDPAQQSTTTGLTEAQAAQIALYQSQQMQLLQQMQQQQPNSEQLRQMYNSQMMMMPQFLVSPSAEQPVIMTGAGTTHVAPEATEEEPVYVNAKQYHRIMIRRQQRAKLEAKLGSNRQRKAFLHQSRHKHAMRRPRGPGGRFLTRAEIAMLKDGTMRLEDLPMKAAK
ncbi:hypothetical protein BBO99_00001841 [Phytophthora kernoviae]|uniref:Nuclear transcription factor Y subunit n=2 Tax=Phytophthora kernoviae TaxID=325452 RepID=A0A3R7KMY9_9STRA|nr:hypothetical protein G195_001789 [Phytophthora kernoviae 00238/432]KAG2531078.1 hypothetical protein JM16_001360 [Phytophthora kernoviae]KAG2531601.1 hypothetical protein JM18_001620 [Phytophthora kernoviae]RLN31794.1 hypothetical protein BBI17_001625 [Phytophthora kernoviae]RLN83732.1 hypothetical protein BBO99_00001841 [Phytophthora kernoviae]